MKIQKVIYETEYCSHEATLSNDPSITFVISKFETERKMFVAAIELALFKITDNPCGSMVRRSLVTLDDGNEYEYPIGHFSKEGKLPYDRHQFSDYVVGQNPLDTIEYARGGPYAAQTNVYINLLSAGRMVAIRWDTNAGLSVEHGNRRTRSVFAMSQGELAMINLATRLADLKLRRHPFLIFAIESIGLLDPDHKARFYVALSDALQPDSQILFLGRLLDVLGTPLTMAVPNIPVFDLDKEGDFQVESEDK